MPDNSTLLAHLVPKITGQVEDAATDALAYILNKSANCMGALNGLLREGGFGIEAIVRVDTQVTYEDGSRPDMTGYDARGVKRLLVESKFWAALLEGQASAYAEQFDHGGPAALLFIAPEVRLPTLWAEIRRQIGEWQELEPVESPTGVERAKVVGEELHVILVSWRGILERMDAVAGDDDVKSDVRQLRALAQKQDSAAFLPIRSVELSPSIGRRLSWYAQLADDVVDARGIPEGWLNVRGLRATPRRYGYGRYFRFEGVEADFWFGVHHARWADTADSPLWVGTNKRDLVNMDDAGSELNRPVRDGWLPIYPKLGVEYPEVLDDVVSQLKAVHKALLEQL